MTDLHDRFAAWLDVAPHTDPPRDIAVHAAFCADCQCRIAARDALAAIDVGSAGPLSVVPSLAGRSPTAPGPFHIRPYARVLSAVVLGVATGVIVVQSMRPPAVSSSASSPTPIAVGAVLGATGTAAPSARSSVEPSLKRISAAPARTPSTTAPESTDPPIVAPLPQPTLAPITPGPTPVTSTAPTPSIAPSVAPSPSISPTPPATPASTPTPTATPADTATPTQSESPTPTP